VQHRREVPAQQRQVRREPPRQTRTQSACRAPAPGKPELKSKD
jgi:hypothetical protein